MKLDGLNKVKRFKRHFFLKIVVKNTYENDCFFDRIILKS